ncbi:hypothetical protein HK405_002368, partial [Cladochytrium tenue]
MDHARVLVVVVVAVGTRGDVEPCAALAVGLARRHAGRIAVRAVTHDDLIPLFPVPPLTAVASIGTPSYASSSTAERAGILAALLVPKNASGAASVASRPDAVIFNLFALDAHAAAEALGVPCLAVSTFV